jgi:GT2 family glycosyltransferase
MVVNFNRMDLLKRCLASLSAQEYPHCEIVVVDNGSTDGSAQYLESVSHLHKVVLLDKNTGFTGGNIAGFKLATGDFIALVNNDSVLAPDWVDKMVGALEDHPEAGYCGCKILRSANLETLDSAGGGMTTSTRGFNRGDGEDTGRYGESCWVFWATAASVLYRRTLLEDIGFLDPTFFFGCEDADLGFRAQLAGWKCRYVADAVSTHKVNASHLLLKGKSDFYFSRNTELLWVKNMPLGLLLRYLHHHIFHEILSLAKKLQRPRSFGAAVLGKVAVLPLLPHALRERRRIQGKRKLSPRQLDAMLTPLFSSKFLARAWASALPLEGS